MPPRRPRRPLPPRRFDHRKPAARKVHPLLLRANQLFSNGKYMEAANLYEKLAKGALDRGLPRAPLLFLQAGKSLLATGRLKRGVVLAQRGLGLLADQNRWRELHQFGYRTVNVLNELGYEKEAQNMEEWLKARLPEKEEAAIREHQAAAPNAKPDFPVNCSACGARVHPDEVVMIDTTTAECSFCGSIIKAR